MYKKDVRLEIDCAPGPVRPDTYFKHICENILHIEVTPPISTFFGEWTWKVNYETKEQADKVGEYLTKCYNNSLIRYACWDD